MRTRISGPVLLHMAAVDIAGLTKVECGLDLRVHQLAMAFYPTVRESKTARCRQTTVK